MKRIIILGLCILFLVSFVFGASYTVGNFYGQTNPFNVTTFNSTNYYAQRIQYVSIPKYSYVNAFNFTIENNTFNLSVLPDCFQESANVSTTCGGYDTGSYAANGYWGTNPYQVWDGDYDTKISSTQSYNLFMNYSIPIVYTQAIWNYKIGNGASNVTDNISLPNQCYNWSNKLDLWATRYDGGNVIQFYCYNGTDDILLLQKSGMTYFYEEAIYWVYNSSRGGVEYTHHVSLDNNINKINITFTGEINETKNISLNISYINDILSNKCICNGCFISGNNCILPVNIQSNQYMNLTINLTNLTYSFGIDNCSNDYNIPSNATAFNFFFVNTFNNSVNVNISSNLNYLSEFYGFSVNEKKNFSYCIYPNWFNATGNITPIEYIYPNGVYTYYSHNALFDNITNNIYLQVNNNPTAVTAIVYNQYSEEVEDAYIYVQEYDIDTNTYSLIGIYKTNFEGQAKLYLTLNTVYYRFLIYYPETTLLDTTTPTYIFETSISFSVTTGEDVLDDYYTINGITHSLTYNNNTRNFRFVYSDTASQISQACLRVYRQLVTGDTLYNSSCLTSTSGTILLHVENISGAHYLAKSFVTYDSVEYPLDTATISFPSRDIINNIGFMGLVIDIIITIAFAFTMMFSLSIGVLLLPLPTLILALTGLIAVDVNLAIGLQIAALVVAIFISESK